MKKLLSLFVVVVLLFSCSACASFFEETPSATDSNSKPKLEVVGDIESSSEKLLGYYSVSVSGVVKNNTSKTYSYASITYSVYDEEGNLLGSTMDNINNLEGGATWKFKTTGMISSGVPKTVKISDLSGF